MTDRVLIPVAGVGTLALSREQFAAALAVGASLVAPAAPVAAEPSDEVLMDSRQLGAFLGIGDTTIEQMAKDGRIPCVRIGKALRFERAAVLAALREGGHADNRSARPLQGNEFQGRIRARNQVATASRNARTTGETL